MQRRGEIMVLDRQLRTRFQGCAKWYLGKGLEQNSLPLHYYMPTLQYSQSNLDLYCGLVCYNTVESCRQIQTFQRNLLLQSQTERSWQQDSSKWYPYTGINGNNNLENHSLNLHLRDERQLHLGLLRTDREQNDHDQGRGGNQFRCYRTV